MTGYLTKPFSQNQLLQKIRKKNTGPLPPKPASIDPTDQGDRDRQRQLAELLFNTLHGPLQSALGQWQQTNLPASAAQALLTPAAMANILSQLEKNPDWLGLTASEAASNPSSTDGASLSGSLEHFNLIDLFNTLATRGSTGELRIHANLPISIWIEQGRIALAAPLGLAAQLENIGISGKANVKDEGRPAIFDWFAQQSTPPEEQKRLLLELTNATIQQHYGNAEDRFSFYDAEDESPAFVGEHTCDLDHLQIHLQALREITDWTQVEQVVGGLDTYLQRALGFSGRSQRLSLQSIERQVLAAVNKHTNLQGIIEATGRPTFDVFHACFRLCRIGLLTIRQIDDEDSPSLVLVADPEADELVQACQEIAQEHHLILKACHPSEEHSLLAEAAELSAAAIVGGELSAEKLQESGLHWFPTEQTAVTHQRLTQLTKPIQLRALFSNLAHACAATAPLISSPETND